MSKAALCMPEGWTEVSLGDVVRPRKGKADPQSIPEAKFIGMEQVEAHTMRLLGTVPAGSMRSGANVFCASDVLYGRLRSYLNKVYSPDFAGLCSGEFIVLPETDAILGHFLKYRLNAGDFVRFATRINTGDRPRVDFDQIKVFRFLLPPRSEQARIVEALDELLSDLDAGVAALMRVREKLKLFRASVLKAAVEGTLTAEWRKQHPQTEPASELLKRILTERRHRWEEDQLRKFKEKGRVPPNNWKAKYKEPVAPDTTNLPSLPEGWCWARTEQTCDFITKGTTPPGLDAPSSNNEIPFIKVQHLSGTGSFHFGESPSFVSHEIHKGFLSRSIVHPDDVLMNIVGPPLGQVSIVPDWFTEWNVNQAISIFRAIPGLSHRFLALSLLSHPVLAQALRRAKTTAGQVNLTLEVCRDLAIPFPPFREQEAIVEAAEGQLSIIAHLESILEAKLNNTKALRQSLLCHAFSGQLVPQDLNNEPASELLKRIADERERRTQDVARAKRAGKSPRIIRTAQPRRKKKEGRG